MGAVSAKFKVSRLTAHWGAEIRDGVIVTTEENGQGEVELTPDYAGGRNEGWSKATPSGVIRMTITNPAALEHFREGQSFDVILTPTAE